MWGMRAGEMCKKWQGEKLGWNSPYHLIKQTVDCNKNSKTDHILLATQKLYQS